MAALKSTSGLLQEGVMAVARPWNANPILLGPAV
jgi:hypothetical protein